MKRSFINRKIKEGITFLESMNFQIPPFAYWKSEDWETKGAEYDEIRDCMLGWDITDFGTGDFDVVGLLVITLRNGLQKSEKYFKEYAEKCLILQKEQMVPMHYHYYKMEDIINRGGSDILVRLYNAGTDDSLDTAEVPVYKDGHRYFIEAGGIVRLKHGESITLPPRQYHMFWAENDMAVVGEVSKVNDDNTDNHFFEAPARFPEIEEDVKKEYLLFSEYPKIKGGQ